jgi:hypothetical protein
MSALPPKADMCSALAYVCFGPKADIAKSLFDLRVRRCFGRFVGDFVYKDLLVGVIDSSRAAVPTNDPPESD